MLVGGIETVAAAIGADMAVRLPGQNKKQREGLALLVATALDVRGVNLNELAAALPRAAERLDLHGMPKISRADVAHFILAEAENPAFVHKLAVISY